MHSANYNIQQIKSLFPQLKTSDLELFLSDIKQIIQNRKKPNKSNKELELLAALNDTALPEIQLATYIKLKNKRQQNQLSETENQQFIQLIETEQDLQLQRIHILGQLAQLRNISIIEVANQLGINPPESV